MHLQHNGNPHCTVHSVAYNMYTVSDNAGIILVFISFFLPMGTSVVSNSANKYPENSLTQIILLDHQHSFFLQLKCTHIFFFFYSIKKSVHSESLS